MAFCKNCGQPIDDKAYICPHCGTKVVSDVPSVGLKVLCFFFPIIGLILYIVKNKEQPVSAKAYGIMAIIGFCVGLALSVISNIFTFML